MSGLAKGEVLVPKVTPAGPSEARVAWASALGTKLLVTFGDGEFPLGDGEVGVMAGRFGGVARKTVASLCAEYERPNGQPIDEGVTA